MLCKSYQVFFSMCLEAFLFFVGTILPYPKLLSGFLPGEGTLPHPRGSRRLILSLSLRATGGRQG